MPSSSIPPAAALRAQSRQTPEVQRLLRNAPRPDASPQLHLSFQLALSDHLPAEWRALCIEYPVTLDAIHAYFIYGISFEAFASKVKSVIPEAAATIWHEDNLINPTLYKPLVKGPYK